MQTSLKLPTVLTLQHCYELPQICIQSLQSPLQLHHAHKQVVSLIKSYQPPILGKHYPVNFPKLYLLIKINSLAKKQCGINHHFLDRLVKIYNTLNFKQIEVVCTEAEILSQILMAMEGDMCLSLDQLKNISQGNGLLAASCVWLIKYSEGFLKKQEYGFSLSFLSLGGRQSAFIPIIHEQKYHSGQIYFAKRAKQLFNIKHQLAKELKVQDPYSMRCTPQVYGVSYDCLWQLKSKVNILLNKPHIKNIKINNLVLPNLQNQSDVFYSKMDFLICSLQEIGATMLLRTQRILNQYLGKNRLRQQPEYMGFLSMLKTSITCTSKNKILSEMTNFDTCNLESFRQDIFYNSGSYYNKIEQLFNNLYYLLTLECLTSIEILKRAYQGDLASNQFLCEETRLNFSLLCQNVSIWDKAKSISFIKNQWLK